MTATVVTAILDLLGLTAIVALLASDAIHPKIYQFLPIGLSENTNTDSIERLLFLFFLVRVLALFGFQKLIFSILGSIKVEIQSHVLRKALAGQFAKEKSGVISYALGHGATQLVFGVCVNSIKIVSDFLMISLSLLFLLDLSLGQFFAFGLVLLLIILPILFISYLKIGPLGSISRDTQEKLLGLCEKLTSSIDSLISLNRGMTLTNMFQKNVRENANAYCQFQLYTLSGRYFLEVLIFLALILFFNDEGMGTEDLYAVLVVCILRVLPSLNSIARALPAVAYNVQGSMKLIALLDRATNDAFHSKPDNSSVIKLVVQYDTTGKTHENTKILDDEQPLFPLGNGYEVGSGTFTRGVNQLVGKSGVGKTVFLKNVWHHHVSALDDREAVVYIDKNPFWLEGSLKYNVECLGLKWSNNNGLVRRYLGCSGLVSSLGLKTVEDVQAVEFSHEHSFSTGELMRLTLIRVLMVQNVKLLCFDESLDCIDAENRSSILKFLENTFADIPILVVTHSPLTCYRTIEMSHG